MTILLFLQFLAQGAGDNSDSESFRSDISETFIGSLFQRRPGSGRRKKQLPWRSPWDASECNTDQISALQIMLCVN